MNFIISWYCEQISPQPQSKIAKSNEEKRLKLASNMNQSGLACLPAWKRSMWVTTTSTVYEYKESQSRLGTLISWTWTGVAIATCAIWSRYHHVTKLGMWMYNAKLYTQNVSLHNDFRAKLFLFKRLFH